MWGNTPQSLSDISGTRDCIYGMVTIIILVVSLTAPQISDVSFFAFKTTVRLVRHTLWRIYWTHTQMAGRRDFAEGHAEYMWDKLGYHWLCRRRLVRSKVALHGLTDRGAIRHLKRLKNKQFANVGGGETSQACQSRWPFTARSINGLSLQLAYYKHSWEVC